LGGGGVGQRSVGVTFVSSEGRGRRRGRTVRGVAGGRGSSSSLLLPPPFSFFLLPSPSPPFSFFLLPSLLHLPSLLYCPAPPLLQSSGSGGRAPVRRWGRSRQSGAGRGGARMGRGGRGVAHQRARLVGACDVGAVGRRCACGRSRGTTSVVDRTSGGGSVRAWLGSGEEEEEGPGRAQRLYKGEDL